MPIRLHSTVEMLESRIAPATLVSPTVVTYQDVDGDTVTIKASKPIFDSVATANAILKFSTGVVSAPGAGTNAMPQQLQLVALTNASPGVNLSILAAVSKTTGGDGFADVGAISALGVDLGAIKISGDLGQIDAGDAEPKTRAVKSLTVQSLGVRGVSTQGAGGALASVLTGGLGALTVAGDIQLASVTITGASAQAPEAGGLGKLTVGGSVVGDTANTGLIDVSGKIGSITVKGDLRGGTGNLSGRIEADGTVGKVTIGGSMLGNTGTGSGSMVSSQSLGAVKVGRDLKGGGGADSGQIDGSFLIQSVTIGGSVIGAGGEESGAIRAEQFNGVIQKVTVGRDVQGGSGEESAYIHAGASLGPIKIGGSVRGGAGPLSALIYGGSAVQAPHFMTSVTIGGDLIGGTGNSSGSLGTAFSSAGSNGDLTVGKITIKGSVIGVGTQSASITGGTIASISIGGEVTGGAASSANIFGSLSIGSLKIGGGVTGGAGNSSAVIGGTSIKSLKIGRDLQGGAGQDSAAINIFGAGVKTATIGGSIVSGAGARSGAVTVQGVVGSLTIKGSVLGTAASPVLMRVAGPAQEMNFAEAAAAPAPTLKAAPLAIGKLSISGSATYLRVLGGYGSGTVAQTADVSLGPITVGGSWTASSVVAGINPGADGFYGGADDVKGTDPDATLVSRIASIAIKGRVLGTTGGNDTFGFVAQQIGKISVGKAKYPALTEAKPVVSLSSTGDVFARLVGGALNG